MTPKQTSGRPLGNSVHPDRLAAGSLKIRLPLIQHGVFAHAGVSSNNYAPKLVTSRAVPAIRNTTIRLTSYRDDYMNTAAPRTTADVDGDLAASVNTLKFDGSLDLDPKGKDSNNETAITIRFSNLPTLQTSKFKRVRDCLVS